MGGNLSDQIFLLPAEGYKSSYAPNFEKVEGAHCFGLRPSICQFVRSKGNSEVRVLKFHK